MHGNAFFTKGRGHTVCQDYALSTTVHGCPLVILCDGCSSSPNTDIGARLIAHSIAHAFHKYGLPVDQQHAEIQLTQCLFWACETVTRMSLSSRCLDVTILLAYIKEGRLYYLVVGDGTIHLKKVSEDIVLNFHFPSGAPYYFSYELNIDRKIQYEKEFGIERYLRKKDSEETIPLFFFESIEVDDLVCISLLSDGYETFTLDSNEVLAELTGFKNYCGAFVERRVQKALANYSKQNLHHHDDISVAAIYKSLETPLVEEIDKCSIL